MDGKSAIPCAAAAQRYRQVSAIAPTLLATEEVQVSAPPAPETSPRRVVRTVLVSPALAKQGSAAYKARTPDR